MKKIILMLFLVSALSHAQNTSSDLQQAQNSTCQIEVLFFENQDLRNGIIGTDAQASISSMCSGVIVPGEGKLRTDNHCLTDLGYDKVKNNSTIGRVVCNGGKEVHYFGRGQVKYNPKWVRDTPADYPYDYATISIGKSFQNPAVQLPESLDELNSALLKGECAAFGYASQREADGHRARLIKTSIVDPATRKLFVDNSQGQIVDDKKLIYLGYQNTIYHGDSGGPLFCKNSKNKYILVGNITAEDPIKIKWNVPQSSVQVILPDGSLLRDLIYLYVATSISSTLNESAPKRSHSNLEIDHFLYSQGGNKVLESKAMNQLSAVANSITKNQSKATSTK